MRGVLGRTVLSLALMCSATVIWANERVALVIGNGAYENASVLANPTNDAKAIADKLQAIGFEVFHHEDLTGQGMRIALGQFTEAALQSDVAMVFYAGHGIEMDGQNYLIPVDAKMQSQATAQFETISLTGVLSAVRQAGKLGMVLLDACRDNPFSNTMKRTHGTRAVTRGLAPVKLDQESGIIVSFAAQAGSTADDGDGMHSPYTSALLSVMDEPGLEIGRVFRKVRAQVRETTNGKQTPIERMQLPDEDVYLVPAAYTPPKDTVTPEAPSKVQPPIRPAPTEDPLLVFLAAIQAPGNGPLEDFIQRYPTHAKAADARKILTARAETAFWATTKEKDTADAYRTYILVFSNGQYVQQATSRLAALTQPVVTPKPTPAPTPKPSPAPTPSPGAGIKTYCTPQTGNWSVANVKTNDTLFVRSGPSKNNRAIGELPYNAEGVTNVSCNSSGWCRVTFGCIEGYAYGRYLKQRRGIHSWGAFQGQYSVTDHPRDKKLNVRAGPSTKYDVVAELPADATGVQVSDCQVKKGVSYRWCTVSWQNVSGWAYGRYLRDWNGNKPRP